MKNQLTIHLYRSKIGIDFVIEKKAFMGKKLFLCLQQREGSSGSLPVRLKDPCNQQAASPSRSRRVKSSAVPRVKGVEWRVSRNLGGTTGFLRPISGGGGLFFCALPSPKPFYYS